jgi:hypothetical protein
VILRARVVSRNPTTVPIKLWVNDGGRPIEIPIAADGGIARPAIAAKDTSALLVESNQPAGTMELRADMYARLPDASRFHYSDLVKSSEQANALMKRKSGLLGFFAPTMQSATFQWEPQWEPPAGCSLTLHLAAGPRVHTPDAEGKITLRLASDFGEADPAITTNCASPTVLLNSD